MSRAKLNSYFLMLLIIILSAAGYAAQTPARKFSDEEISRLQRENEYGNYKPPAADKESAGWWDDFVNTINEWLSSVMEPLSKMSPYIIYTIAFILLVVLLAVIMRMNGSLPFGNTSSEKKEEEKTVQPENIHDIEFNKEIQTAIKEGNYRKAVRLYYLASLKLLSDKRLIDWQSYKTNREYVRELRAKELRMQLEEVTFMFELVWYGEVEMNKEVFDEILIEMQDFQQAIKRTII